MAACSTNPLWKKLGYKTGLRAFPDNAPTTYAELLGLPAEVNVTWLEKFEPGLGFVHVFTCSAADLSRKLAKFRKEIAVDGVVWVSWPKKSSGVATDITEDVIRKITLPMGWVDIKVCAVDEIWSGLKLMIRRSER